MQIHAQPQTIKIITFSGGMRVACYTPVHILDTKRYKRLICRNFLSKELAVKQGFMGLLITLFTLLAGTVSAYGTTLTIVDDSDHELEQTDCQLSDASDIKSARIKLSSKTDPAVLNVDFKNLQVSYTDKWDDTFEKNLNRADSGCTITVNGAVYENDRLKKFDLALSCKFFHSRTNKGGYSDLLITENDPIRCVFK
jgi:hypothetical protein